MSRVRFRIRTLLLLILLSGIGLWGYRTWRAWPVYGAFDDPSDQAYVQSYFDQIKPDAGSK